MILSIYILLCIVVFALFATGMALGYFREFTGTKFPLVILFLSTMILSWGLAGASFNIELILCGSSCAIQQYVIEEMAWLFYGLAAVSFMFAIVYTLLLFEGLLGKKKDAN